MNVGWFGGWDVVVRTLIAGSVTYVALIVLLRIAGSRTLAKWYAFDLVVTVALGSTFANGVLSKDISIAQAVAGFMLLIVLQYSIASLAVRFPSVVRLINPAPVLLLVNGRMLEDVMRHNRVTKADICKAVRSSGGHAIEDTAAIVLEPDGTFSVVDRIEHSNTSALSDVPNFGDLFPHDAGRGKRSKTRAAA